MKKVVNIYPKYPITSVNPPIRTSVKHVSMPTNIIRNCLMARATVEEILPNGKIIRLGMGNYDTDNMYHDLAVDPIMAESLKAEDFITEPPVEDNTSVVVDIPEVTNVVETVDLKNMAAEDKNVVTSVFREVDPEPIVNDTVQTIPVTEEEKKVTTTNNANKVNTAGMTKKQRKEYYRKLREEQAAQTQPVETKESVVETASQDEPTVETVDVETLEYK